MANRIEPVGLVEIAARLGVKRGTANMWHYRSTRGELPHPMPEPQWTVSGQPAWNWPAVQRWAKSTGRAA